MKTQNRIRRTSISVAVLLAVLLVLSASNAAIVTSIPTVDLGTSAAFAVLAGSTVTNTGSSLIGGSVGGNVGVWPGTAIVGFPPGVISDGVEHAGDATAQQAQTDLTAAYLDAAGRPSTLDLSGQDLGGKTLTTGVYTFISSAQLTGTLTLDAQGDPDAVFIFQIGSALTTASSSTVSLIGGALFSRVFWQIGSSATLGTDSTFVGDILALTSITANTGATVQGQLLARNGAVTLDSNTLSNAPSVTPTVTPPDATRAGPRA